MPKGRISSPEKPPQKAQPPHDEDTLSKPTQGKITLRDLCPEEKAKIGELLKRLATTKSEKEAIEKMREEEKQDMTAKLQALEHHNRKLARAKQKLAAQVEQYEHELALLQKPVEVPPPIVLKEEGTQAEAEVACEEKGTQVMDEQPRPQEAVQQVQSLKREIATLSSSLRNFNASSMNSQMLSSVFEKSKMSRNAPIDTQVRKPTVRDVFPMESPDKEERFRSVLERAALNSQRAKRLMTKDETAKPSLSSEDALMNSQSVGLQISTQNPLSSGLKSSLVGVSHRKVKLTDPPLSEDDLSLMDIVYNESLFDLVEEMENDAYVSVHKPQKRGDLAFDDLELSAHGSPWLHESRGDDSLEDLHKQSRLFQSSLKQSTRQR